MTVPTVRTLPAAPEPTDSPDVFDQKAFELSDSLAGFVADVNAVAAAINEGEGGTGTVTSVAMTVPIGLEVSGSPITGMGTFAVTLQAGYSIPTTDKQTEWDAKINSTLIGAANGVAPLNSSGQVPSANLPSYVDDVIEVANFAALPGTGEVGKIYITLDTNYQYRWSGSAYIELVQSPGTTDNVPEGATNLYHTGARVRAVSLAGFVASVATFTITAADTVIGAFQKIQGRLNQLGTAANLNTGTGTGDIPLTSQLNTRLGTSGNLGDAAQATLTSSATDTTAGRVPTVGWLGWGGGGLDVSDLTSTAVNVGRLFRMQPAAVGGSGAGGGVIAMPYDGTPVTTFIQVTTGGVVVSGAKSGASGTPVWRTQYGTGNTSADVQAMLAAADNATIRSAIGAGTGSGNGTVTSVAMSVPTGLTVTGSPISSSGTFAVTLTAGYSIPTTVKQTEWDAAYSDRNKWDGGATGLVAATGRASLAAAKKTSVVTVSGTTHNLDTANESAYHNFTNASAKTVTVRPNSSHALETDGAWVLHNDGTGNLTVTPFDGTVTIKAPYGGTLVIAENMTAVLQKVATNTYHLVGQTVAA